MKVYQENGILITGENACILYTPGQMQHYQAVQKFRNSYLHFVAQENPAEYFQLPQNQIFYPQNPEEIEEIIRKLQPGFSGTSHGDAPPLWKTLDNRTTLQSDKPGKKSVLRLLPAVFSQYPTQRPATGPSWQGQKSTDKWSAADPTSGSFLRISKHVSFQPIF